MRRIRDLVVYILIACVVVIAAYWASYWQVSQESLVKWGGLSLNTVAIFGWLIMQSRPLWHNRVFWWTVASLPLVHVASFWVISKKR